MTRLGLYPAMALLAVAVLVTACGSGDDEPPTLAPTPTATVATTASGTPTATSEAQRPGNGGSPSNAATGDGFAIRSTTASATLPESIDFTLDASADAAIEVVDLEFGTEHIYDCASSSYTSVRLDVDTATEITTSWEWDMRRTGSIPPGSTVWWRWRLRDVEGNEYRSERNELAYEDDRFDWQSHQFRNITLYWHAGGADFGERLADALADGFRNIDLGRELVQPIKAYIYESAEDVRGAILFAQQWTGGLAFGSENTLLITVSPAGFERDVPGVVHELTHLRVNEITFNCFGHLPRWLSEGLATYSEGPLAGFLQAPLDEAIAADQVVSIRSLNSSFPAADSGATLSYGQSRSIVAYLIDRYGWPKMQELLDVFSEGSTFDGAFQRVYGMDLSQVEDAWRDSVGLAPNN